MAVDSATSSSLNVYFHSNRPLKPNNTHGLVAVQGWRPYSYTDSVKRYKRSDGASHPYHAKFGVAQSAKYDFLFREVLGDEQQQQQQQQQQQAPTRAPPPYLLADTDVIFQCSAAEIRARFERLGSPLVIGAEFAWFPKRDYAHDPWPAPRFAPRHELKGGTHHPQSGLRYPNSGLLIGSAAGLASLSAAFRNISRYPCCPRYHRGVPTPWCHIDDQHCLQARSSHARTRQPRTRTQHSASRGPTPDPRWVTARVRGHRPVRGSRRCSCPRRSRRATRSTRTRRSS